MQRLVPLRKESSSKTTPTSGGSITILPADIVEAASRRVTLTTTDANNVWMGPGSPPGLTVQPEPDERKYDYPVNYNTRFQPKSGEGVTFAALRLFADSYDLLRVVIERRKDQVEAFEWSIGPRKGKKHEAAASDDDIELLTSFFEHPSTEYSWSEWVRALLEDLLVLDAVAIAPRFTYGNAMYSLDLIDPATIKRVIDDRGMTPMPPDPAYQQILKGVPAVDFTVEELYYWMRNPRTWKTYGFSPVEWIIVTVNIALQRQAFTMSYFTEGNIPEALATVPDTWTTKQIKEFQTYWDDIMEGSFGNRRRMRFIPMDASKVKELKQPDHKNEFEEWLARLICFAFSISPSALIKDMNRATADTNKEIATEDGLIPLLNMLRTKINYIIQRVMGFSSLEFNWDLGESLDAYQQAQIDDIYIKAKVITPDEVRDRLGKKPLTDEERSKAFPAPPPMLGFGAQPAEEGEVVDDKANPKPGEKVPAEGEDTKPKDDAEEEPPKDESKPAKLARLTKEIADRVIMMRY